MEYWMLAPFVVWLASIPWLIQPLRRAVQTKEVGFVYERLIFGFWFPVSNLSDRKNSLEIKLDKLTKEVGKTKKLLEDETKALKTKVDVINKDYQSHLLDQGGKRTWKYLWRKCHVPSFAFVQELVKKQETPSPKGKTTYFTLENLSLPKDFVHEKDKGRVVKRYVFHDNSKNQNQQGNNNQRKKGNQNNQNQQGNNNQNN